MALIIKAARVINPPAVGGSVSALRSQSTSLARVPAVTGVSGCLNKSSGIAVRNGTSPHTIGGSSPSTGGQLWFTTTAGNQLAVIIGGGVTNTSSGTGAGSGWTKRTIPIASAELTMFTKTAVGGDFLTVTHNGNNYPIIWAFYELSPGMTYINHVGESAVDDTFPTLTGLPATSKFILAAYCRSAVSLAATDASATTTAPWVEDVDLFTEFNITQGVFLHVSYQDNFTGTSVTPPITPTFVTSGGAGFSGDRQKIVAAFNLP